MPAVLDTLAAQLGEQAALPPVHLWHPELSGDIDIVIRRNGEWWHEGGPIQRQSLVNLFASILRREDDGHYYLVTPVEKWRIAVEDQPLLVVDFDVENAGIPQQRVIVTTNVDRKYLLGKTYPVSIASKVHGAELSEQDDSAGAERIPVVELDNGLQARFDRPAWYRLVDAGAVHADRLELVSDGQRFTIGYL